MKKGSLADRWIAHLAPKADDLHRDLYGSWLDRAVDDTERTPLHPSETEYQIDEREASIVHLTASMIRVAKDRGMKLPDPSFATDLPLRKLIATISASSPLRALLQSLGTLKGFDLDLALDVPIWEDASLFVQALLDAIRGMIDESSDPRRYSREQTLLRSPDRILSILFCCVNRCDLIKDLHFPFDSEIKQYALLYRSKIRSFGGIKE